MTPSREAARQLLAQADALLAAHPDHPDAPWVALYLQADAGYCHEAAQRLGEVHARGLGVPVSIPRAVRWYRKAVKLRVSGASLRLGALMDDLLDEGDYEGYGGEYWIDIAAERHRDRKALLHMGRLALGRDDRDGQRLLRWAAEKGCLDAAFELGVSLLQYGEDSEALLWLKQAAEAGHPGACRRLGQWLLETEQDDAQALLWLERGALGGDAEAAFQLGSHYDDDKGADAILAARWFLCAAELGHRYGQINIAIMYNSGEGVLQDDAASTRWYREAALQGDAQAQLQLSSRYCLGNGTAPDLQLGLYWCSRAANDGVPEAQWIMGRWYQEGKVIPVDIGRSRYWLEEAAKQGHAGACYELASLLLLAPGFKNPEEAGEWMRQGAEAGHDMAQYGLAMMLEDGLGMERDRAESRLWLQRSAERGNALAKKQLQPWSRMKRWMGL